MNEWKVLLNEHYKLSSEWATSKIFNIFIYAVLKQVHPELRISKRSIYIMNSFVNDILHRIANEARNLTVIYSNKKVLTARAMQTATSMILPGELHKHAINQGIKDNQYRWTTTIQN